MGLFVIVLLVELLLDDSARERLLANLNLDGVAQLDRGVNQCHGTALVYREQAIAGGNDTYLAAWRTIPPKRPSHFFAYLAKICRNFAFGRLDWRDAAKRRAEVVTLSEEMAMCIPDTSREQAAEGKEITRALNAFLGTLSQENRVLFVRRYWYVDTIAEIAQRYHMSESKVKTRLHRIREKLRGYLEQEGIAV